MELKPISKIKLDLGINLNGRAQKFFTETCYSHMDKYVPKSTGNLGDTITMTARTITYEMPYAHYQYIGKLYVMPHNMKGAYYSEDYGFWSEPKLEKIPTDRDLRHDGGRGAYWDKRMVSAEMDIVAKEVEDYVRRGY